MTRLTTGVDLIEVGRIQAAINRWGDRFLIRVYTDAERTYCGTRVERFAGRFAAKEAASKALGVGIRYLRWKDIEVLPDSRRKPRIYLHGRAAVIANRLGIDGMDVSITHSRTDAIAFVVAWTREEA